MLTWVKNFEHSFLFWMFMLFYFCKQAKLFYKNPKKPGLKSISSFLLDNNLQSFVVVCNKSVTRLLPRPFFFGKSLKLLQIWRRYFFTRSYACFELCLCWRTKWRPRSSLASDCWNLQISFIFSSPNWVLLSFGMMLSQVTAQTLAEVLYCGRKSSVLAWFYKLWVLQYIKLKRIIA